MIDKKKLDALDLVITVLCEHEHTLDSLINRLERLVDVIGESMVETRTLEARLSHLEETNRNNRRKEKATY